MSMDDRDIRRIQYEQAAAQRFDRGKSPLWRPASPTQQQDSNPTLFTVVRSSHGWVVGTPITRSGGTWSAATSRQIDMAVVIEVVNSSTVKAASTGTHEVAILEALSAGSSDQDHTYYYVDPSTSGKLKADATPNGSGTLGTAILYRTPGAVTVFGAHAVNEPASIGFLNNSGAGAGSFWEDDIISFGQRGMVFFQGMAWSSLSEETLFIDGSAQVWCYSGTTVSVSARGIMRALQFTPDTVGASPTPAALTGRPSVKVVSRSRTSSGTLQTCHWNDIWHALQVRLDFDVSSQDRGFAVTDASLTVTSGSADYNLLNWQLIGAKMANGL